jgi:regulatory protein
MKKRLTDIQIDEAKSSHRTLFLDGVYFDSVDADCIPKFGLRVGLEIEADVLQKLIQAHEGMRAKNYALELLSNQSYSKSQMINQLGQKGFVPQAIDTTMEDLEQLGYIKDESFAKKWVDRRRRSKPKGKKMLQHELVNKKVDKATVDRVLEGIHDAQEAHTAMQLAQKQIKRYQSLPPEVAKRRLHGFLLRRGFDYETVQNVIERILIKGSGQ